MIREATASDADAIAAVHVASWNGAYRGLLPDEYLDAMDVTRWATGWQRRFAELADRAALLVSETPDGEVVGFVEARPTRDDDVDPATVVEITTVYVHPGFWGRGVGRELMAAVVPLMRDAGFAAMTLWVLRDNKRARRFYELAGWKPDGAAKDDVVAGAPVTEVRYRRDL